ncbi:hypothetical protein P175DRAFT_0498491 [Aspergillus ochraceoroseus IBT 24754]|uniref:Cupin type-2 domain-containing protein n=1 Tax=Aspergillus ochraceoroseus IBT 24754 TaxID=1392256 RepID=A0A2T5MA07_9EURO|nr:uncharacterized protein P175DRAFT_0498491 [Aspergillus ochraceoroseus IBT 24754]PTU25372.1 hypothetical protein P175DRAFT_0498491 [Aspergillus ochraceoroseus IBT 24754]
MESAKPRTAPIVYHADTISKMSPESFPNPNHGQCTWHTLFSQPQTPRSDMCAGIAHCPPYLGHLCRHRHKQAEIYYITKGRGRVFVDGETHSVLPGSVIFIPGDAEHGIANESAEPLEWFYVFPAASFEDI